MMSWSDWHATAEREAARTYGKNHASTFMAMRLIGPGLALAAVGAVAYGAWWIWNTAAEIFSGGGGAIAEAFPIWTLPIGLALLVGTGVALRPNPGRVVPLPITLAALLAAWIWLIGYLIGFIG